MELSLIVLAAGMGSRMNSDLPKVLHPLAAVPLLHHALAAGQALQPARIVVVTGHGADLVAKAAHDFDPDIVTALQDPPQGTAHAVAVTAPLLSDAAGEALVLYGDTPFVRPETLQAMLEARASHDIIFLGFQAADPTGYGRFVTEGANLLAIVEEKQATEAERQITLCNSGVVAGATQTLLRLARAVPLRANVSEYYLTDIIDAARAEGLTVGFVTCPEAETLGINTRAQLAAAEAAFQTHKRAEMMEEGVTLISPETTFFARDTYIGRDATVGPAVIFGPGVTIETGAEIKGFCHLEGCHISRGATVGPFARLRPGAELAEDVHVGNFVEIKNAVLDEGVKVGHLTYLGDAHVGEFTNIGAGTVTCNYDGVMKHRTTIGKNAFIGSDTMLVAPVTVGDHALTASGSVITENVPAGALAVGRAKQVNKPGLAVRLMEKLRALKAAKKGS
ncbi:bifunctional UDP-N-acetylglucosamine diphosphorylase/glucosamine-1-phosphate N-acetyltransferase GlmU [Rhodobacter sp. KR11]|uniref:bifunctional UDP-N-acetylglucosamine diphosphorylase/glucosamine-1-phosphate N-acetyltransferase GlmU n=1 Tax=Rhodobacter sp. KR11 TaxID=2974588 RepID=UPI0022232F9D|nr:bifunctional UDP-N-acetylglucosamine diphosphorylase/glucosamine-1-phosphate N-acetyltransferase GlmU [Rhodobacter sp. KR11]MCW1917777.1 bifunctional UDP-N-acetylglucosamine diphosphorylase/glucosamine-1-phosphate N-acetyltransferase GlmU [Rhodobacter sp. KR11]